MPGRCLAAALWARSMPAISSVATWLRRRRCLTGHKFISFRLTWRRPRMGAWCVSSSPRSTVRARVRVVFVCRVCPVCSLLTLPSPSSLLFSFLVPEESFAYSVATYESGASNDASALELEGVNTLAPSVGADSNFSRSHLSLVIPGVPLYACAWALVLVRSVRNRHIFFSFLPAHRFYLICLV